MHDQPRDRRFKVCKGSNISASITTDRLKERGVKVILFWNEKTNFPARERRFSSNRMRDFEDLRRGKLGIGPPGIDEDIILTGRTKLGNKAPQETSARREVECTIRLDTNEVLSVNDLDVRRHFDVLNEGRSPTSISGFSQNTLHPIR